MNATGRGRGRRGFELTGEEIPRKSVFRCGLGLDLGRGRGGSSRGLVVAWEEGGENGSGKQ